MLTPQVTSLYPNLMAIGFPERSGHNGISAQEQLFDKLIKQALTNNNKRLN